MTGKKQPAAGCRLSGRGALRLAGLRELRLELGAALCRSAFAFIHNELSAFLDRGLRGLTRLGSRQ
jgi:hypothetical protein